MVAKEKPILLEEFCAQPVCVSVTERRTLPILRSRRLLRDHIESQLGNGREAFDGVLLLVSGGILGSVLLDLCDELIELIEKHRVRE